MATTKAKPTPAGAAGDNLAAWITDPRSQKYFGETFKVRAEVLAAVIAGGNLAELARALGVSRQYVHRQAVRAREIFLCQSGG